MKTAIKILISAFVIAVHAGSDEEQILDLDEPEVV